MAIPKYDPGEKYITTKQAAGILGVSESWLRRAKLGNWPGPPCYQLRPRGKLRWSDMEVRQFAELHRIESKPVKSFEETLEEILPKYNGDK